MTAPIFTYHADHRDFDRELQQWNGGDRYQASIFIKDGLVFTSPNVMVAPPFVRSPPDISSTPQESATLSLSNPNRPYLGYWFLNPNFSKPILRHFSASFETVDIEQFGSKWRLSPERQAIWQDLELCLLRVRQVLFSFGPSSIELNHETHPSPSQFGYLRSHKTENLARKCAMLSRDCFLGLMSEISWHIGFGFDDELNTTIGLPVSFSKIMSRFVSQGVPSAFVDQLIESSIASFSPDIQRVGAIWDLPGSKARDIPTALRMPFLSIPLWILWGPVENPSGRPGVPLGPLLHYKATAAQIQEAIVTSQLSANLDVLTHHEVPISRPLSPLQSFAPLFDNEIPPVEESSLNSPDDWMNVVLCPVYGTNSRPHAAPLPIMSSRNLAHFFYGIKSTGDAPAQLQQPKAGLSKAAQILGDPAMTSDDSANRRLITFTDCLLHQPSKPLPDNVWDGKSVMRSWSRVHICLHRVQEITRYIVEPQREGVSSWTLLVESAVVALFCVRICENTPGEVSLERIVCELLRNGLPFMTGAVMPKCHLALPSQEHLRNRKGQTDTYPIFANSWRPLDWKAGQSDYTFYEHRLDHLLSNPSISCAALMRGGIVWRLAIETGLFNCLANNVTAGPSQRAVRSMWHWHIPTMDGSGEFADDGLSKEELNDITGSYLLECRDSNTKCMIVSWWPRDQEWRSSPCQDRIAWTAENESWFQHCLQLCRDGQTTPRKWDNLLGIRQVKHIRKGHEAAAVAIIDS